MKTKPYLPTLSLIILAFVAHSPQWILGLSTDPIWFFSGIGQGLKGGILTGVPFLDPNAGFTTEALGHLAAWDWWHGAVPWWNSYTGIGMPLAGEMQPGAFFLPFNLLLLLPHGVLWLQITMQVIGGLATFALLRELGLSRVASVMAGMLFELNGSISWTPGPIAISCALPFLPLLLWAIERGRQEDGGLASVFGIAVAIAWSILAGFPETAYIDGLLALCWATFRVIESKGRRRSLLSRVIAGGILGLMIAAPLLIAFVDYLLQSDALSSHGFGNNALIWPAFSAFFMPYVFGPTADGQSSTLVTSVWGNIGGYAGILVVLLATISLGHRRSDRGLRIFLVGWILVAWAKTFGVPPIAGWVTYVPFLSKAAFYRYSPPSWELAIIILAGFGLDAAHKSRARSAAAFAFVVALLAASAVLAWPKRDIWNWTEQQLPIMLLFFKISLACCVVGLLAMALAFYLTTGTTRRISLACLVVLEGLLLFAVPQASGVRQGQIDDAAIQFLRSHQGLSRNYTLGPLLPNYGAYFRVASIDHNVLPVPKLWADYVDQNLLPGIVTRSSGVIFWPGEAPTGFGEQALLQHPEIAANLGVKYVIAAHGVELIPMSLIAVGETGNRPLALNSGDFATERIQVPQSASSNFTITAIAVLVGTYNGTADGVLTVTVCDLVNCEAGLRTVADAADNAMISIPLDRALSVRSDTVLTVRFDYRDAKFPIALWQFPQAEGVEESIFATSGNLPGRSLRLGLQYADHPNRFSRVYGDALLSIWELTGSAPYFEVVDGGPCVLSDQTRNKVTADCSRAAHLMRRELFMPGWLAKVNDNEETLVQDRQIFQTIALDKGVNQVRYRFSPPFAIVGCLASCIGMIVLAIIGIRLVQVERFGKFAIEGG